MDGLYDQFRIALHQVWRRRWLAMAVAWGVAVLGWLVIALIPSSYEAKARLFVQPQSILPNQLGVTPDERNNQMLRLKQTITSNDNLVAVVRRTDLNSLVASEADLPRVVGALRQRITITAQPDGAIEITGRSNISGFSNGQNARTAAATVQGLIDRFIETNMSGDRRETGQSLRFLDEELARREAALQQAEQQRLEFERQFMGVLPGTGTISDRMSAARVELANLEQQIAAANGALQSMRGQLAATPRSLPGAEGGGTASGQLAQLEGRLSQYRAQGWTDSHPDVRYTRQQIERLRPFAAQESRSGTSGIPNPAYVSLRAMMAEREATLAAASARRAQLQSDLSQLTARQTTEPGMAAEQARLSRDYEVLKQQYDQLLASREQVRLRGDVATRTPPLNVQVVEPPSVPSVPAAPNRPIFLTAVLFLAIGAGIAAAFVAGQIQTTFPTQQRLASVTGLPVLGMVSEVITAPIRALRRRRLLWLGGAGGALAASWAVLILVEFWQRSGVA